jgi:hypothetical protein
MGRPAGRSEQGVTQGVHVRAILVDPCVYLISSANGPVAGDEHIDVARHALKRPQRGEVAPGGREAQARARLAGHMVAAVS